MRIDGSLMKKSWLMNRRLYACQAIELVAERTPAGRQPRSMS
jgi:hypothetical protein